MPATASPSVFRVASAPMVCSPGLWRWFESAKAQPRAWKVDFIQAFLQDRASKADIDAILTGKYTTAVEADETLVLTVNA